MPYEPEIENLSQLISLRMCQGWQYFIDGIASTDSVDVATGVFEGRKVHTIQKKS